MNVEINSLLADKLLYKLRIRFAFPESAAVAKHSYLKVLMKFKGFIGVLPLTISGKEGN